jgi:hypothetical protein
VTFVKGQSGNPSGQNIVMQRTRRMLEGLGPRAVAKLERLLDGDNDALAFQAAKEILSRVAPVPKTGTVLVQHSASPHLAALVGLATATAARVIDHQDDLPMLGEASGPVGDASGPVGDASAHLSGESGAPSPDIPAESG